MTPPLRAAFMVTCLGDMFYPEVGERIVRLLRGLGVSVDFPSGQTCCRNSSRLTNWPGC